MKKRKHRLINYILLVIILLAALIVIELYRSSNLLMVNEYVLESDKISNQLNVIIISDLHDHDFGDKLSEKIKNKHPDLIIMAGDMINRATEKPEQILNIVKELKDVAPIYYGVGNHERIYVQTHQSFYDELEEAGCIVLEKEYKDISIKNNNLRIGGLYEYPFGLNENTAETAPRDIAEFMSDYQETDRFKLMISHLPDSYVLGDSSKVYDIDLVVSGHIHGGQVVIPFKGGIFGGDQGYFPHYVHGLYRKDKINILVTSGLGSSPKKLPRFNNPPEIVSLVIRRDN